MSHCAQLLLRLLQRASVSLCHAHARGAYDYHCAATSTRCSSSSSWKAKPGVRVSRRGRARASSPTNHPAPPARRTIEEQISKTHSLHFRSYCSFLYIFTHVLVFILPFLPLLCHCFYLMICMHVCYVFVNKYSMLTKTHFRTESVTVGNCWKCVLVTMKWHVLSFENLRFKWSQ